MQTTIKEGHKPYIIIIQNSRGKEAIRLVFDEDGDRALAVAKGSNNDPFWRPVQVRRPTVQDMYDIMDKHDWYYAMSDDHRVWKRGEKAQAELREAAKQCGTEVQDLYDGFVKWINACTAGEEATKPERP